MSATLNTKETTEKIYFWYSRRNLKLGLFAIFLAVLAISALIPPMQSPDEPTHLNRAYLLSKGIIFTSNEGGLTGGYINRNLFIYENLFATLNSDGKSRNTEKLTNAAKKLEWEDQKIFVWFPNTASYLPFSYLPQALALRLGESLNLSINQSYYLCRFFSLSATILIVFFAFSLFPASPITITCFLLPMSLFQMGTTSLDSITFSLFALTGAIFMRVCNPKNSFPPMLQAIFFITLFLIINTRLNFFPLAILPLIIYYHRKSRSLIKNMILLIAGSISWFAWGLLNIHRLRPAGMPTATETMFYYLSNPIQLIKIFYATLFNKISIYWYWQGMIGIFGWLDTPLADFTYLLFFGILLFLGIISFQKISILKAEYERFCVSILIFISLLALFSLMLFAWTPPSSKYIEGIQGRYFIPFLILIGYIFFDRVISGKRILIVKLSLVATLCASAFITSSTLLSRY